MPNGKNEPSQHKYESPKDEPIGMSSYMYEEHRFRKPEEFPNAWRHPQTEIHADKKGKVADLEEEVSDLSYDLDLTKSHLISVQETLKHQRVELKKTNEVLREKEESMNSAIKVGKIAVDGIKELLVLMKKFGGHTNDCEYIDALTVGRVKKSMEKDLCSCGWYDCLQKNQVPEE